MRRRQLVLGGLIVVLLLAAAFAAGLRFGDRGGWDAAANAPPSTTVGPALDGAAQPPVGADVAGASPGTVAFSASARSIVVDRGVVSAPVLSLRGAGDAPTLRFTARVQDGDRRDLGTGAVVVSGLATVKGDLTAKGVVVFKGGRVFFGAKESDTAQVDALGGTTVDGASITFARNRRDGPPEKPEPVRGPLRLQDGALMVIDGGVEWSSPGEVKATSRERSTVSWAGSGEVTLNDGRKIPSSFGGVKGTGLRVVVRPAGEGVNVTGQIELQQAYADGLPQLTASADVAIKVPPRPVGSGGRGEFTWAPFNGGAVDMVMTRIRPGNELARSISLALEKLPAMCGAEACPFGERGGDTNGFPTGAACSAAARPPSTP